MNQQGIGFVYLIALVYPLGSPKHRARFYLGSCKNLNQRMKQHRNGTGSRMLKAANERGIAYSVHKFLICESESQARALEQRLKRFKRHRSLITKDWRQYLEPST
ncbi:GIY-YIG nuclease family protein [Leptolyngbya sp. NIES-2104]|uniref:GIY-YIG nuclease family protein n=1 Tax=Leptolyngbya sp. NIES-2104 TaxID=1552121 RepID=UPI00073E55A3|nr:GIY-YIG nuclease family protein [Leptolyngbya sp. NIES-2104]